MFTKRTVFVIGAGASKEVGLPLGVELRQEIAQALEFKTNHWGSPSEPNQDVLFAIRAYLDKHEITRADRAAYDAAAREIREAIWQAESIDNFIEARQGNKSVEILGKMAIADIIAKKEQKSKLIMAENSENLNHKILADTWYPYFAQLLWSGLSLDVIEEIFENVTIICFNYDRCIEHFLVHSLRSYYGVTFERSAEITNKLRIYHPYGTIGTLPWITSKGQEALAFGLREGSRHVVPNHIIEAPSRIRTFSERYEDQSGLDEMTGYLSEAKVVVFLGFAYYRQNLKLMQPLKVENDPQIYGSTWGLSDSDREEIKRELREMFLPKRGISNYLDYGNIILPDLKCADLLVQYGRAITRQ